MLQMTKQQTDRLAQFGTQLCGCRSRRGVSRTDPQSPVLEYLSYFPLPTTRSKIWENHAISVFMSLSVSLSLSLISNFETSSCFFFLQIMCHGQSRESRKVNSSQSLIKTRLWRETVRTKRHAQHISYSWVDDSENTFEITGRLLHASFGDCF